MASKVLIVDDSATVRQQVRLALTQAGLEVLEACDGLEGLEMLKAGNSIKVVVCDVNMPRMNGIEMLEKVGGLPSPRANVLILTTEGQPALVQKAKALGAKGWVVKPFKAELLIAAVQKLMNAA